MSNLSPQTLPSGPEGKKSWGAKITDGIATAYAGLSQVINGSDPAVEFEAARISMWRAGERIKKTVDCLRSPAP